MTAPKRLRPHRAADMGIRGEVSASVRGGPGGSPTRAPRAAAARGTRTRQPRWGARGAPAPVQKKITEKRSGQCRRGGPACPPRADPSTLILSLSKDELRAGAWVGRYMTG